MKQTYSFIAAIATAWFLGVNVMAQQLPNADFEDWSAAKFDGNIQPASWNVSNVTQLGFQFNFAYRETGRTGYALRVQSQDVGAAGITETSPGYVSLGHPWVYLKDIASIKEATAGTYGGVEWTWRPDTMEVWIKRTGNNTSREDYYLLYYAWSGTAQGTSYKGKNGKCTSVSKTDEESDIRQALDGNECTTSRFAKQIAEGMVRERQEYTDWTCMKVPIYYMNSDVPEKMNIIFSASNYPNFRANSGLYDGDALYIDDVRLIYSSKIQSLYIGNKRWNGFDPNSTEEQVYSVGNATTIPAVYGMRGEGALQNVRGDQANFTGRRLSEQEFVILQEGSIDGEPMIIEVKAEDGSSTSTYKIKFVSQPSNNARLATIKVNGTAIQGFNGYITSYNVALPYGTTAAPVVEYIKGEDQQEVSYSAATSPTGTATLTVKAADGKTTLHYTLNFSIAPLSDNTLQGIRVNGEDIQNFNPTQTIYKVELPLSTTTMPTVEAVSAYPAGAQTIAHTAPATIDGGQYQLSVSTPGRPTPKVYKLNFKVTASTYSFLAGLEMEGGYIYTFSPEQTTYYVNLPLGTTQLPKISYTAGDSYQNVAIEEGGIDGTTRITVTAAAGNQTIYKIVCTTEKSSVCTLKNIFLDGKAIEGFSQEQTVYDIVLPIGTTQLPKITYTQGDEYQTVSVQEGGTEGVTRISVVANDGTTNLYQLRFSVEKSENNRLQMIYLNGEPLADFAQDKTEYTVSLPEGTTALPEVGWLAGDAYQNITYRAASSLNGEARIVVKPASGATTTYIVRFVLQLNSETHLENIYLDGEPLSGFSADTYDYTITLPQGESTLPSITFASANETQRVLQLTEGYTVTLRVTAANGDMATYTLRFEVVKSSNAFLRMIYIDGSPLAGFDSETLSGYEVVSEDLAKRPVITYDKEPGQRVTVICPVGEGKATIEVCPEEGSCNKYIIRFRKATTSTVQLKNIFLDGVALNGFQPTIYTYNLQYEKTLPTVTYETFSAPVANVLYEKEKVTILLSDGESSNAYTLQFAQHLSEDMSLNDVSVNGVSLEGFVPSVLNYTYTLPVGADKPQVDFKKQDAQQQAVAGWENETTYAIQVTAADEREKQTYRIRFDRTLDDDCQLQDILLDGISLPGFEPDQFIYNIDHVRGEALPELTYVKKNSQTVVYAQTTNRQQTLLVVAENGSEARYTIDYSDIVSQNALLSGILLDGIAMEGFRTDSFTYVDTLAWRTKVVPSITPIPGQSGQQTTVYYSGVNGQTRIHVVAEDGVTTADYRVSFPVRKSANTLLESVTAAGVEFDFAPETTEYTIVLPYQMNEAPLLSYEKQEEEQQVDYLAASVQDTSLLTVTAENGDTRTYRFAFQKTYNDKKNRLDAILLNGVAVDLNELKEVDSTHLSLTLPLAYGITECNISCVKAFDEQNYLIEPGGLLQPTRILVYSNRPDDAPVEYRITPQLNTQSPAVLTSLSVNGVPLPDFDKNKFSYILVTSSVPNFTYTAAEGVLVTQLGWGVDSKSWSVKVQADGYENTYKVLIHNPNDAIPNGEFTEWTNAAKRTSAMKPVSWQVAADYADSYGTLVDKAYTGTEIVQGDNNVVSFYTKNLSTYLDWGGGGIPSVATLGTLHFKWGTSGSTESVFHDSIPFQNTPDSVVIRYHHVSNSGSGALFAFRFWDEAKTEYKMDYLATEKTTDYITYTHPLTTDGKNIQSMNIAINASNQTDHVKKGTELHVDYLRFIYNSRLRGVLVGGEEAAIVDNQISYTLASSEDFSCPELSFVGEVSDQTQTIVWSDEVNGVRTAAVRNYAEDGTFTDYSLSIKRPLSAINTLRTIHVDGQPVKDWNPTKEEYTLLLSPTDHVPTITAERMSHLQTVKMDASADMVRYMVTSEAGVERVYTIHLQRRLSGDVTLKNLVADGITYDASTTDYMVSASAMPKITFEKQSDAQRVFLQGGVVTVTAEDGTTGQYRIDWKKPAIATSGALSMIAADDVELKDFSKTTYRYQGKKPSVTAFVREFDTDSVVQIVEGDSVVWDVYGTEQHRYVYSYPKTQSAQTNLAGILLNGVNYDEFLPLQSSYVLSSDANLDLQFLRADDGQILTIERTNGTISVKVQAEDGTLRQEPYLLTLSKESSDNPCLQMIYINGEPLDNFEPDRLQYDIMLPASDPKKQQPQLPDITYMLGQSEQSVTVETAPMGGISYLVVTAEDGNRQAQYELRIMAEPSHNAYLSGIYVNGKSVSYFNQESYRYSAQVSDTKVNLQYSTEDRFQTITIEQPEKGLQVITVLAEDGVTTHRYAVDIYQETLSDNANLHNILLDGEVFSSFDPESEDFLSKQLRYSIKMPTNAARPDLYVVLGEVGQSWELLKGKDVDTIRVTAADGVSTDDYIVNFVRKKSGNVSLSNIYIDGLPLKNFDSETLEYAVSLPVGTQERPVVDVQKAEAVQTVSTVWSENDYACTVTAENGATRTYKIHFSVLLSGADTLSMIYADGLPLETFVPHRYYYAHTLPEGQKQIPQLTVEQADSWQTVTVDTILSALSVTYQFSVLAQNGRKNVYTVVYNLRQSADNTLEAIMVNNRLLQDFSPEQLEYTCIMSASETSVPEVTWLQNTALENIQQVKLLSPDEFVRKVVVTAENGNERTYTIYFQRPLSGNAFLKEIYYGGQPVANFDEEILTYQVSLPYGTQAMPLITFQKNEEAQNVTLSSEGWRADLKVVAADGTMVTYTITFSVSRSNNDQLALITLNGEPVTGFDPAVSEYHISLPYDAGSVLPAVDWKTADEQQVVAMSQPNGNTVVLQVTAGDGENVNEYMLLFSVEPSPVNTLSGLQVRGTTVEGFSPDICEYTFSYPAGSTEEDFFSIKDVTYQLTDPNSSATVFQQDKNTVIVSVVAASGDVMAYVLRQEIALSSNAYLSEIRVNGEPLADFSPEKFAYEYLLLEGSILPVLAAVSQDSAAEVSITTADIGEETFIYCTAPDGTEYEYTVLFRYADINTGRNASENDVIFKHIPGTNQYIAATIRQNVKVALYDAFGHRLAFRDVPVCDPNVATVVTGDKGQDIFADIASVTDGAVISLDYTGKVFFYVFFQNEKNRIASGKVMLAY